MVVPPTVKVLVGMFCFVQRWPSKWATLPPRPTAQTSAGPDPQTAWKKDDSSVSYAIWNVCPSPCAIPLRGACRGGSEPTIQMSPGDAAQIPVVRSSGDWKTDQ